MNFRWLLRYPAPERGRMAPTDTVNPLAEPLVTAEDTSSDDSISTVTEDAPPPQRPPPSPCLYEEG